MLNLIRFIGLRNWAVHPLRTLLTVLGVACGVALFIAIRAINHATLDTFRESVEAVAGRAALTISAPGAGIPEERVDELAGAPGVKHAVAMIESRGYAFTPDSETLMVFGLDLLRESTIRTYQVRGGSDEPVIDDLLVFLNQPDSILLTRAFALPRALAVGSALKLATARGPRTFRVRGLLDAVGPAQAYGGAIAVMDIDAAALAFGKPGLVDRIDLVLQPGADPDRVAATLRERLGPGLRVETPGDQVVGLRSMIGSFQSMLAFFSSLSLLVGTFLVSHFVTVAVAERRKEIGTLRAVGATRKRIAALFLGEAVALGAAGGLLGAAFGKALSAFLLVHVARALAGQTATQAMEITTPAFGAREVLAAVGLGALAAAVAASVPALRAGRISPMEAIRGVSMTGRAPRLRWRTSSQAIGGVMLAFIGVASYFELSARHPWLQPWIAVCGVLGAALFGPLLVWAALRASRRLPRIRSAFLARLARDNLLRSPAQLFANSMNLMIGMVMVIVVLTLNASFKSSMTEWLDRTLFGDLYVSSGGSLMRMDSEALHEDLGVQLLEVPGVDREACRLGCGVRFSRVDFAGKSVVLKAYDEPAPRHAFGMIDVVDRAPADAGRELFGAADPVALVSENFAATFGRRTGDRIELGTPGGPVSFRIVGLVRDYASPIGTVHLARPLYRRLWRDPRVNAFTLEAEPGTDPATLRVELDRRFGRDAGLTISSNVELKRELSDAVDESFAYAHAIEASAMLVAMLGLLNALLVSVLERRREFGMLRAAGMSARQLWRVVMHESLLLGAVGAVVASVLGAYIAWLWIESSVSEFLGWRVAFHFPAGAALATAVAGVIVAVLAAIYPAGRAARLEIREALKHE